MKKILILGKSSYLGQSFFVWMKKYPLNYEVNIVSTRNYEWKKEDFSYYDVVVDFAGAAHIKKISNDMKPLFYSINRDLSIELGEYSKRNGVKHFIFFSSMNVYGDYCENITDRNAANPMSFYGDSKLQGDIGLHKLADNNFIVASIRPPFVYGKGCSGNYRIISQIAKKIPVFPRFSNKKSMIYIDNLCEFVRLIIDDVRGGVFTPQNKELVSTSVLVKEISKNHRHKIFFTNFFNWSIILGNIFCRKIRRAFGDDYYSLEISDYYDFKYCVVDFEETIRRTEM